MKEKVGIRFIGLVNDKISDIENEHGVKVISASQSSMGHGRNWYTGTSICPHIRFIYIQPKDYYLSIQMRGYSIAKDFYDSDDNPILETNGYDLKRALIEFSLSCPIFMQSIITAHVYMSRSNLNMQLNKLIPYYFSAQTFVYHYWLIADRIKNEYRGKEQIPKSEYLMFIRAILSADFVLEEDEPPPATFWELIDERFPFASMKDKILELHDDDEDRMLDSLGYMNDDLYAKVDKFGDTYPHLRGLKKDPFFYDRLNRIFREHLED